MQASSFSSAPTAFTFGLGKASQLDQGSDRDLRHVLGVQCEV
jgi:hypothetical protein